MKHTLETHNGVSIIVIQGDLWGGSETCELHCRITEDVRRLVDKGERAFVLDLARANRINSIGIGVLVAIHASIQNAKGALVLCSVNHRPHAALEITGLTHLFRMVGTREAAVEALSAAPV